MKKVNKTLSQRVSDAPEIIETIFTKDRILWGQGETTEIPSQIVNDPLVSTLVKYYNSGYFIERNLCSAALRKTKRSLEFLINAVILPLGHAPDNVLFEFIKAVRTQISNSDNMVWSYFIHLTPPIYILGGCGHGGLKRLPELLNRVLFSEQERAINQRICLKANRPRVTKPEFGYKKDLIEHLDLDVDGQEVVVSLRLFASWFITEWAEIRKRILDLCPEEVDQLRTYISQNPDQREKGVLYQNLGGLKNPNHAIDIIFRIVKAVNHPMLTERFAVSYLCLQRKGAHWNPSKALMELYDLERYESQAATVNFIHIIESHYIYKSADLPYTAKQHAGRLIKQSNLLKCPDYWKNSLGQVMSITELLGITPEEEICFAWLLASDRHQPSNIARMYPEDIEETTSSLTTFLNPQSVKFRSRKVAGTPYAEGDQYKKNGFIFEAIKAYKQQVQFAYAEGYFDYSSPDETSGPILPRITARMTEPSLQPAYFRIHKTVKNSLQLLLCLMSGSLSNVYATQANPKHQVWLDVMMAASTQSDQENQSKGFKTLACDYIQRQTVNNMLKRSVGSNAIPLSSNNNLAVISEQLEFQQEIEAANHNHSVAVRSETYLDNAPKSTLLAPSTRFGARVGDEMIRMGLPLAERMANKTQALTIAEARKLLGLEKCSELDLSASANANIVLEQAKLQDYIVDEIGIATRYGQSIILKTPLTVALIQTKIEHIDFHIDSLLASNDTRADKMIAHRIYLQLLLDEFFSKKEIRDAQELYGGYEFPMNDLLV